MGPYEIVSDPNQNPPEFLLRSDQWRKASIKPQSRRLIESAGCERRAAHGPLYFSYCTMRVKLVLCVSVPLLAVTVML
jgi:hypothetical protein